jgi:hypothetical protein
MRDGEIFEKDELSLGGARWLAQIISLLVSIVEVLILFSWDLWYCSISFGVWIFSSGSQVSSVLE